MNSEYIFKCALKFIVWSFQFFINELHIKVILITNLNYNLDLQRLRNKLFSKLNVEDLYRVATIVCNMGILGNPSSGLNVLNYPDVKLLMKYNMTYKSFMDLLRYYLNTTCTSDPPRVSTELDSLPF